MLRFVLSLAILLPTTAHAQFSIDAEPIHYSSDDVDDPVARLIGLIDAGEADLQYDPEQGWLPSLLRAFDVPVSSQGLVFSKTSLQRNRIAPRTPRALYFSDDLYVGWVPNGDVIELSAVDPQKGAIFYTVDQHRRDAPVFVREMDRCVICHSSTHTRGVPGHIVRSVYPDADGMPLFRAGTYRTDHTSPFDKRWGGWYVTGTHGGMRHMGNELVDTPNDPENLDVERGANLTDVSDRFASGAYLSPHSDIVALMVLEHQVAMHNAITSANYSARLALRDKDVMNAALDRPDDYESDSTRRRLQSAAEDLLKVLLMCDEFPLTAPVEGTSGFADEFAARGPRDARGRSLRHLDLQTRLFRYPCHHLIYSEAFAALPERLRLQTLDRLYDVLTQRDRTPAFAHLTPEDRRAIFEILRDTLPGLPEKWQR